MTIEPKYLTVHVLGAGKGESIVLQLPDGGFGVVDCCARSLDDPTSNPTVALLNEIGGSELEFLCLTHPHDDHFRGMSQILDRFPTRCFWYFGAQSAAQFEQLVNYVRFEALQEATPEAGDWGREFPRIWSLVEARRKAKTIMLKASRPGTPLYPVPIDTLAHFQIVGLAPSENQAASYVSGFKDCFDREGRFHARLPRDYHNRISVALRIKYGQTRVILGGDVERPGWLDVLQEVQFADLAAHLVKVPHHGSENGYCENLWSHFSASGKPDAVVTSYASQGLPRRRALEVIRDHANTVLLTCGSALRSSELPSGTNEEEFKSRLALLNKMGRLQGEGIHACGRWTLVFDVQGNCVHRESSSPAIVLNALEDRIL